MLAPMADLFIGGHVTIRTQNPLLETFRVLLKPKFLTQILVIQNLEIRKKVLEKNTEGYAWESFGF